MQPNGHEFTCTFQGFIKLSVSGSQNQGSFGVLKGSYEMNHLHHCLLNQSQMNHKKISFLVLASLKQIRSKLNKYVRVTCINTARTNLTCENSDKMFESSQINSVNM